MYYVLCLAYQLTQEVAYVGMIPKGRYVVCYREQDKNNYHTICNQALNYKQKINL